MSQARIQHAVSLLTPFDQLPGRQQGRIGLFKDQFPHDDELTNHLTDLHLPVLVQYLVWIPFDNFAEVTRLGNEGFSTVWKGTVETKTGQKVFALKEIDTSMFQEVVLNAVHTVQNQTYDFMEIIGLSYQENTAKYLIVMEFAQGGSLEQHFHNVTKATSWVEIYNLARRLTQNLYSLHYIGLMHHDLHPGNVVFPDRTTRIIDVGLAKVIANSTTNDNDDSNDPRGCYGRLAYFPPECFSGEPYTTASDMYCLGTILWQIVSHVPPRGTAGAMFRKDGLREDPVPGTPTGYQDIINECWSVDPDKRPTAGDVQRRIQNMMRTGPGATLFASDVPLSRYSPLYLRALIWNRPARKTRVYVARKVNEHRRELAAEITDSLDLLEGSGSASMHRSRYYSRRQLARYYRPQVDPSHTDEVIQVASSFMGADEPGPKTLRSARSIISRVLPRSSNKQQHP